MEGLSVAQLKEELKSRDLSVKGNKEVLRSRLQDAIEGDVRTHDRIGNNPFALLQGEVNQDEESETMVEMNDLVRPDDSVSQASCPSKCMCSSKGEGQEGKTVPEGNAVEMIDDLELKRLELEHQIVMRKKVLMEKAGSGGNVAQTSGIQVSQGNPKTLAQPIVPRLPIQGAGIHVCEDDRNALGVASRSIQTSQDQVSQTSDKTLPSVRTFHDNVKVPLGSIQPSRDVQEVTGNMAQCVLNQPPSVTANTLSHSGNNNLMEALISYNLRSSMPKTDIPKFGGDPTQYKKFCKLFDMIICNHLTNEEEKLMYLDIYTIGDANDIVQTCVEMPVGEGYKAARRRLEKEYGNEALIARAYIDKIVNWPDVRDGDVASFKRFTNLLVSCQHALNDNGEGARELEHPSTIRTILHKLPFALQEKWRDRADDIVNRLERSVTFKDLVKLIEDKTRVMSNPDFGRHVMNQARSGASKSTTSELRNKERDRGQSNARVFTASALDSEEAKEKCGFCKGNHPLDDCVRLSSLSVKKRLDFVYYAYLCFGCLKTGHTSKECQNRKSCLTCGGQHPTILHRPLPISRGHRQVGGSSVTTPVAEASEVGTNTNNGDTARVNTGSVARPREINGRLSVIPVKVRGHNGELIPTHAFLDDGSTVTFCTNKLLRQINHQKAGSTHLTISTMYPRDLTAYTHIVTGIEICDPGENNFILLPPVYTADDIPATESDVVAKKDIEKFTHLQPVNLPEYDVEVGLLIGTNAFEATEPLEIINSEKAGGPYAVRTKLGWVIKGSLGETPSKHVRVNKVRVNEATLDETLTRIYNQEFEDVNSDKRGLSGEDRRWLKHVEANCKLNEAGHYVIGMPFTDQASALPNNKASVKKRLEGLRRKFSNSKDYHDDYCAFMSEIMSNGYAEEVPEMDRNNERAWYIPHHGVYHHQKTDQLRVVFDCAAKHRGTSLNDVLMQGPDLTNPLVDVMIRFRQGPLAFMADIKSMFYQVGVPEKDRDYLRFLWWPDGKFLEDPKEYRMTVHPFGAKSSPSCANFALQRTATDNIDKYQADVTSTIMNNFYVDDCLKSTQTESELTKIALEVKAICKSGGFHLSKFVSNSRTLLEALPLEDRGKKVREISLTHDSLPTEKALGISWDVEEDALQVTVKDKSKPRTKRGVLSTIGAMYDPLGMLAPYLLQGRIIMQSLHRLKIGWDDAIPERHRLEWDEWKELMSEIGEVAIDRCLKPTDFGTVVSCEIHNFSDASEKGYGAVSYLRLCNSQGKVHCAFLFGKSRVAPLKAVTIPRLELTAATLSVKINTILMKALEMRVQRTIFWTDSTTVLRYIRNDKSRYHTFVANRIAVIRDGSRQEQWRYVNSELNSADDASRGRQSKRWIHGPSFLYDDESNWPEEPLGMQDEEEGLEIKGTVVVNACMTETSSLDALLQRCSSWHKLRRVVAWMIRFKDRIRDKGNACLPKYLTVKELEEAEKRIIQYTQGKSFSGEMVDLSDQGHVKTNSTIRKLNPVLHEGLLRVGGRLSEMFLSLEAKHPIILPRGHRVTELIIRNCHERVGHQGREHVLSALRERYWIIHGNAAVRKVIGECIQCRKYQAPMMQQMMSDLPGDTIRPSEPPFTSTGVDCFGPFYTKRGRSTVKRYGVIFTCLTVRAIHIEVAESLSTDSFINALRRFISRRGQVESIRCDRGTNFVGAEREIREATDEWNQTSIHEALLLKQVDWIFNPPHASHYGGVWERQIRTVRKVLNAVMREQVMSDEHLRTLMCEVEAVINSRPITNISSDCQDPEPLTPNHLLIMSKGPMIMGKFEREDMYCKKRWRHVQYLADLFWKRWRKEYLLTLQERQKWNAKARNLAVGDIVLMVEQSAPRCQWPMGRVIKAKAGRDGLVRSVTIRTTSSTVERPVSKLVFLLEGSNVPE